MDPSSKKYGRKLLEYINVLKKEEYIVIVKKDDEERNLVIEKRFLQKNAKYKQINTEKPSHRIIT